MIKLILYRKQEDQKWNQKESLPKLFQIPRIFFGISRVISKQKQKKEMFYKTQEYQRKAH